MNIIIHTLLSNVIGSLMKYADRTNNWNMHSNPLGAF